MSTPSSGLSKYLETFCHSYNVDCAKKGSGALSTAFIGPRLILKQTKITSECEWLFWQNKTAFFQYLSHLEQADHLGLLEYFVVPFKWFIQNHNTALTIEPLLEGYVTFAEFLTSPLSDDPKIVQKALDAVKKTLKAINTKGIYHCDTHAHNIMIMVKLPQSPGYESQDMMVDSPKTKQKLEIHVRLIDYDWVVFAPLGNILDKLATRHCNKQLQNRIAFIRANMNDYALFIAELQTLASANPTVKQKLTQAKTGGGATAVTTSRKNRKNSAKRRTSRN